MQTVGAFDNQRCLRERQGGTARASSRCGAAGRRHTASNAQHTCSEIEQQIRSRAGAPARSSHHPRTVWPHPAHQQLPAPARSPAPRPRRGTSAVQGTRKRGAWAACPLTAPTAPARPPQPLLPSTRRCHARDERPDFGSRTARRTIGTSCSGPEAAGSIAREIQAGEISPRARKTTLAPLSSHRTQSEQVRACDQSPRGGL